MDLRVSERTLYEYLKHNAEKDGDRLCLFDDDRSLTAKDVLAQTEAYARTFCRYGISEGDFVALQTKRSLDAALMLYALQTVGAVTVLCHPHLKVDEYLSGTGIGIPLKAIVTKENGSWEIVKDGERFPCVPDGEEGDFSVRTDSSQTSIIIFTSGSTSASKAVMISQKNMINAAEDSIRSGWYEQEERGMIITPLNHLLGLLMVFFCIAKRYPLFFPPKADSATLFRCIQEHKITFIHGVPTTYLMAAASEERQNYDLHTLKRGMMAGGACSGEQFKRLERELGLTLLPGYGLSECVGISSMSKSDSLEDRASGVGRPFPLTEVMIQDSEGNEVKPGVTGEICARGVTICKGYYANEQATREAFDCSGWFHTGDLGYFDDKGIMHISGRKKDIIIRGGENISCAKIERAICGLPYVRMAVAVGVKHELLGEIPCAVVVLNRSGVTEEQIRSELKKTLLKNEMPERIEFAEELPLLQSGKPDKLTVKRRLESGE